MKAKKRALILAIVCVIVLIGALIANKYYVGSYLVESNYKNVQKMLDDKKDFVLLISKTDCSHCIAFKPKLRAVAKEYKLKIYYVDTDMLKGEDSEAFNKLFSIDGTPTTVFITNGEEKTTANRISGDVSKEKIINKLKSNGFIK